MVSSLLLQGASTRLTQESTHNIENSTGMLILSRLIYTMQLNTEAFYHQRERKREDYAMLEHEQITTLNAFTSQR